MHFSRNAFFEAVCEAAEAGRGGAREPPRAAEDIDVLFCRDECDWIFRIDFMLVLDRKIQHLKKRTARSVEESIF